MKFDSLYPKSTQPLSYDPRRSSIYEVDLYDIMIALKRMPGFGWSHDARDIEQILHNLFSDKDLMMKAFSDHRFIEHICHISKDYEKEKERLRDEQTSLIQSGGISHEDYETAVEVVDEFIEIGLDDLDEGQLEIYQENIELIEKYESS